LGHLPHQHGKPVALDEEHLQQLLVSIMKHRPAQLRIDTLPNLLKLFTIHLVLPTMRQPL
jgi:hypothetical protein